jgi:hypothetical protein
MSWIQKEKILLFLFLGQLLCCYVFLTSELPKNIINIAEVGFFVLCLIITIYVINIFISDE